MQSDVKLISEETSERTEKMATLKIKHFRGVPMKTKNSIQFKSGQATKMGPANVCVCVFGHFRCNGYEARKEKSSLSPKSQISRLE